MTALAMTAPVTNTYRREQGRRKRLQVPGFSLEAVPGVRFVATQILQCVANRLTGLKERPTYRLAEDEKHSHNRERDGARNNCVLDQRLAKLRATHSFGEKAKVPLEIAKSHL
jgi:hypothetical protein